MPKHSKPPRIDERLMQQWAEGTLQEWLPGVTDYDDMLGSQFRIRLSAENVYDVETVDGWQAGSFRVLVIVLMADQ